VKIPRDIRLGDTGSDVEGHGRALCRAGLYVPIRIFQALPAMARQRAHRSFVRAVERLQRAEGWPVDGVLGEHEFRALLDAGAYDQRALTLLRMYRPPSREELAFERLLAAMRLLSDATPGYLLGGGHGVPLRKVSPFQRLDCSSSTSKALEMAGGLGFGPDDYAWVSGQFATRYGQPGVGRYFTVWANPTHVFVQLHRSRWWRFDTSPHGDGGRGPRLRMLPRRTSGFVARHWPGM
jgi:hypothetical protein